jgi:hypothetical protein
VSVYTLSPDHQRIFRATLHTLTTALGSRLVFRHVLRAAHRIADDCGQLLLRQFGEPLNVWRSDFQRRNHQRAHTFANFVIEVKSCVSIAALAKNLRSIGDELCRDIVVSQSNSQGTSTFGIAMRNKPDLN